MFFSKVFSLFAPPPSVPSRHLLGRNLNVSQRWLELQYSLLKAPEDPLRRFRSNDRSRSYHLNLGSRSNMPWMKAATWPQLQDSQPF
jgi:hypothetical protein